MKPGDKIVMVCDGGNVWVIAAAGKGQIRELKQGKEQGLWKVRTQ